MTPTYDYTPDLVLPPGDTLTEVLDELGMTQMDLARRTGLSAKHVNQVVKGLVGLTPETALLLEKATGVHAATWNRLEVAHQEYKSRETEAKTLAKDMQWVDLIPYKELVAKGLVAPGRDAVDRVRELCRFFGVANFAAWEAVWHKPTAYRTSAAFTSNPGAVAAWLRLGEIRAGQIDTRPFDRAGLTQNLGRFRGLTREPNPNQWWPELVALCATVGVALVGEPEIKGARINGAARWLTPEKAIVQLSFRHKWSDIVWFTFFHEIAHLLIHSKKDAFINDDNTKHSGHEQEADAHASQLLIPRRREAELGLLKTNADVEAFSADIGIAPGIVVGRLQFEGRWAYNRGAELKQRFTLT